jgi:hypothetical protein
VRKDWFIGIYNGLEELAGEIQLVRTTAHAEGLALEIFNFEN